MREISCIDETFDNNYTIEYNLSIQVSLDGFSFCILDNLRNKFLLFKHIPFLLSNNQFLFQKVSEILQSEEYLQGKFKNVTVSYATQAMTIIPDDVNISETNKLLSTLFQLTEKEGVKSLATELPNIHLAFAYPKAVFELMEQKFPGNKTTHSAKATISQGLQKAKKKYPHGIISVHKTFYSFLIFDENKLVFSNTFSYSNEMDFIYFVLEAVKSTGNKSTLVPLYINGYLEEKSTIHTLLVKYFFDVIFLKLSDNFQYSYTFSKFPQHLFLNAINPE